MDLEKSTMNDAKTFLQHVVALILSGAVRQDYKCQYVFTDHSRFLLHDYGSL